MSSFFKSLWSSLSTILTSKKTLLAVSTVVVHALPLPQAAKDAALWVGTAAIGGQGLADLGKNAAPKP